jgi:peptidoglycan/LPS O-acetylase OafA/YrhL
MKKNEALEGLRGLACLAVVTGHFLYMAFPFIERYRFSAPAPYPQKWAWEAWFSFPPFNLLYNGDFAVLVFFSLSGYVLLRKFWHGGDKTVLLSSAIKRYPRLIIPACASIAVALLLMRAGVMHQDLMPDPSVAPWASASYPQAPSVGSASYAALVDVPFIGGEGAKNWNGPLWTMRIELLGSLGLFASFLIFRRQRLLSCVAFAAAAMYFSAEPVYFLPFAFGAALNGATGWLRRHERISLALFAAGAAIGCMTYHPSLQPVRDLLLPLHRERMLNFPDLLLCWNVIGSLCMVAGVIGSGALATAFGCRLGAFFGKISFSMYLLHYPLMFSFGLWLIVRYEAMGLSYVTAAWVSYASWLAVVVGLSAVFAQQVDERAMRVANWISARVLSGARRARPPVFENSV